MTNIIEFEKLIERYENITLEDLAKIDGEPSNKLSKITGFGTNFCTLCKAAMQLYYDNHAKNKHFCNYCVYVKITGSKCLEDINKFTYEAISQAKTDKELLYTIRKRAKHMKAIIKLKQI